MYTHSFSNGDLGKLIPVNIYPISSTITTNSEGKLELEVTFPEAAESEYQSFSDFFSQVDTNDILAFRVPIQGSILEVSYNDYGLTPGEFYVVENTSQLVKYISGTNNVDLVTEPTIRDEADSVLCDWKKSQPLFRCKLSQEPTVTTLSGGKIQYSFTLVEYF